MVGKARNDGWHVERLGDALTLSRRLPVRFDLAVETRLPAMGRLKLAHQVRQDVWRALRRLRGFSPAVRVARAPGGLHVTAGGAVEGRFPRARAEAAIRDVLENPGNRARWQRFAGEGRHD